MNYFVQKGDQKLGPFTLAELSQQYQACNILPTDLAQSDGMTDWVPVAQVLGNIPVPASYGTAVMPALEPQVEPVPLPFNLHWALLLLLELIPYQLMNFIWALYLANWARKLDGQNKHLVLVAMYPASMIAGILAASNGGDGGAVISAVLILGGAIAYLVGVFSIRSAMEEYYNSVVNVGLQLSGVMTFFFSTVYLQYHINQLHKMKKTGGTLLS